MKQAKNTNQLISYLDVSEYIIKEHSPLLKPSPPQFFCPSDVTHFKSTTSLPLNTQVYSLYSFLHQSQIYIHNGTPDILPIDHDVSRMTLTPITSGLIRQQIQDIMDDFMLDGPENEANKEQMMKKRRKNKKTSSTESLSLHIFKIESELDKIIEDNEEDYLFSDFSQDSSQDSEDLVEDDHCFINTNTICTAWSTKSKSKSKETSIKDVSQQCKSVIQDPGLDYSEMILKYSKNPKSQIIKQIREISRQEVDDENKFSLIKGVLEKYVVEFENQVFQQAWKQVYFSTKDITNMIIKGIQQTFNKKIGSLSFESRRIKLLKYLEKKKRRIWKKKVSYDCRKKVADGRLRIKGKFVTREQACEQLGVQNLDNFTAEEIKEMLENRMNEQQEIGC